MEGTCNVEICNHAKLMVAMCAVLDVECNFPKGCNNYVEVWISNPDHPQPELVGDCALKRLILMAQEQSNRFVGVQASQEQMRNESHKMTSAMVDVVKKLVSMRVNNDKTYLVDIDIGGEEECRKISQS